MARKATRVGLDHAPGTILNQARYLGGHPILGADARWGSLQLNRNGFGLFPFGDGNTIPVGDVERIEITDSRVAKSKVPKVLRFGVRGPASKESTTQTVLIVHTRDGNAGYFALNNAPGVKVRARLAPLLHWLNIPYGLSSSAR